MRERKMVEDRGGMFVNKGPWYGRSYFPPFLGLSSSSYFQAYQEVGCYCQAYYTWWWSSRRTERGGGSPGVPRGVLVYTGVQPRSFKCLKVELTVPAWSKKGYISYYQLVTPERSKCLNGLLMKLNLLAWSKVKDGKSSLARNFWKACAWSGPWWHIIKIQTQPVAVVP